MRHKTFRAVGVVAMSCMAVWPVLGSVAHAATTSTHTTTKASTHKTAASSYKMEKKAIVLNGKVVTQPYGFAAHGTMYMPIWYVMHTLEQLGIQSTWKNNVWNMTVPDTYQIDMSKIQTGKGKIQLEINGTLVHKVNGIAAPDPATKKATMFIPIWYVQQLLKRVSISSPWDGKTWVLKPSYPDGHPVLPPPQLPANEIAMWQVVASVENAFQVKPDASGTSPYDDIASTDKHWGTIHSAIENHILTPVSGTHSGAYEAVSVFAADTVLWNAYGIQDGSYQPGEKPYVWANDVGLNPPNVLSTDLLTPQEFSQIMSNLANNMRGFRAAGPNTYQIVYPIRDEASATFAGDSENGQPFFTSNQGVQSAILATYQFYNNLQVTNENGVWILTMPSLAGTSRFSYTTTLGDVQYQLPGDSTWQTKAQLDSRELKLSPTDEIHVRIPQGTSLTVSVNEMLPQLGGTVALGNLQIEVDAANGLVVHRIDVSQ